MENDGKPRTCANCGYLCYDRYCPRCGQKTDTGRLTLGSMWRNLTAAAVGGENGLWRTVGLLFTRPNRLIADYIAGKRKNYFSPFPLLFLALAVCLIALQAANSDLATQIARFDATAVGSHTADEAKALHILQQAGAIYQIYFQHFTLITLLFAPVLVVGIRLCFGQPFRVRYNWAETLVLQVYLLVQVAVCASILAALACFAPNARDYFWTLAPLCAALLAWDSHGLNGKSAVQTCWQSVLAVAFTLSVQLLIGGAVLAVVFLC